MTFLKSSTNNFMNLGEFTPPKIMDNLITIDKIEEMTSPRVIKSHLPFYLLPPKLLDTAKVWTRLRQISKSFNYLSENDIRWFTSLAIPRTPSFPSSIYTNWWKCVTTLEKWTTLSTTLSMTNVCILLKFKIHFCYVKSNIKNVFSVVVSLFRHRTRVLGQKEPS